MLCGNSADNYRLALLTPKICTVTYYSIVLPTASEEAKRLFEAAMKLGHVVCKNHKLLMLGTAGTGKSHVLAMLLAELPPSVRSSTPCANRPVRAARIAKEGDDWQRVKEEGNVL